MPVNLTTATWRKARWTDAEPDVQQLLDLLPLLPKAQQDRAWQTWQDIWLAVTYPVNNLPKPIKYTNQHRRKQDSLAFANELFQQLPLVGQDVRLFWANQVLLKLAHFEIQRL